MVSVPIHDHSVDSLRIYTVTSVTGTFTTLQLSCEGYVTEITLILQSSDTFSVKALNSLVLLRL